jgi:lipoprotein NlpD
MPSPESATLPDPSRWSQLRRLAAGTLLLCLAACAARQPAPVEERSSRPAPPAAVSAPVQTAPAKPATETDWRPKTYTVKRGDTLYAIALDHGLDYRELAAWNSLENINLIRPGQVLRLAAPAEQAVVAASAVQTAPLKSVAPVVAGDAGAASSAPPAAAGMRNTENYKTQPKVVKEAYSEQALRDVQRGAATPPPPPVAVAVAPPVAMAPAPPRETAPPAVVARADPRTAPESAEGDEKIDWSWPARGRIVTGFSEAASLKGIDIAGAAGQPVAASAGGKVVYAGTGLRGYGKLIIVKHNGTYLSAYAHNSEIVVKEGQQVARGQKIAEMGNTDADQVKLHFEIRRHGKPVDPLRYLPPA